jgi:hypothetical protein
MFPRVEDAEYVIFDVTADSWPIHPNDQWRLFQSLTTEDNFGVLAAKEGYVLLRRGLTGADQLPDEFYSFARRQDPEMQYAAVIEFGGDLRLLGFDVVKDAAGTSLTIYLQAVRNLEKDYRICPFFFDETGRIIEDTTLRPMATAIWYPTSLWKPGETVWMQTLPWDVGSDFRIGLGVVEGEDWSQLQNRLPVTIVSSTLAAYPIDEGTAVQLVEVRAGEIIAP